MLPEKPEAAGQWWKCMDVIDMTINAGRRGVHISAV